MNLQSQSFHRALHASALLLHLHMEYAETRGLLKVKAWKRGVLFLFYAAGLHLAVHRIPSLLQDSHFNFLAPGSSLGEGFAIVLAVALAWCGGWERRFAATAPDKPQRYFHGRCCCFSWWRSWRRWLALGPFRMDARRQRNSPQPSHCFQSCHSRAHLPRMAAQLLADRPAKESSLCGIGDFSGTALPQSCSPCRYLAGAAASAGGFGVHSVVCAGDFYRAFATRARQAAPGNGPARNGPRAAAYGGNSAGGATRQPREPAVFHRAPNKRRIRAGVGATSFLDQSNAVLRPFSEEERAEL